MYDICPDLGHLLMAVDEVRETVGRKGAGAHLRLVRS